MSPAFVIMAPFRKKKSLLAPHLFMHAQDLFALCIASLCLAQLQFARGISVSMRKVNRVWRIRRVLLRFQLTFNHNATGRRVLCVCKLWGNFLKQLKRIKIKYPLEWNLCECDRVNREWPYKSSHHLHCWFVCLAFSFFFADACVVFFFLGGGGGGVIFFI
jgi:hypothetical protein